MAILTIPSMIPNYSLVLVVLLTFAILFNAFFTEALEKESNINFSNIAIPISVLLLLSLVLIFKSFEGSNLYANSILFVIHFMFLAFFIITKKYLNLYIKSYVVFVFIMATAGLLADLIYILGYVNEGRWSVNLSELTDGSFRRDLGRESSYLFPYNLGFILNGGNLYDFAGLQFYRISGWAHEPTSASLFIAPAIIYLIHGSIIKNTFYRMFMLATVITFWIFVMAIGSLAAFILIYSFTTIAFIYSRHYPKKLSLFLFLMTIIFIPLIMYFNEVILNSSLILSKFDTSSETFQVFMRQISWASQNNYTTITKYAFNIFLWALILTMLYVSINGIIYRRFVDPNSLALFYIVVHSMKGSQESVFLLLFTFFWFYVSYYGTKTE